MTFIVSETGSITFKRNIIYQAVAISRAMARRSRVT